MLMWKGSITIPKQDIALIHMSRCTTSFITTSLL